MKTYNRNGDSVTVSHRALRGDYGFHMEMGWNACKQAKVSNCNQRRDQRSNYTSNWQNCEEIYICRLTVKSAITGSQIDPLYYDLASR